MTRFDRGRFGQSRFNSSRFNGSTMGAGTPASFAVTLTGLTGGQAIIGTHASIGYTTDPVSATETVKWSASSDPAAAATYGTGASPTDFTSADGFNLYLHVTDGGETVTVSAPVRYAAGTAPAIADGQSWTVDDTAVSIDASASGANLTWTYVLTGSATGVTINPSTGLISGTPTAVESGTATVTATDQYGREVSDTFTWTSALRTQATGGADLDLSFPEDSAITSTDLTANWTTNGNTLTYAIVGTPLPTGLSVSSAGAMTGTPTTITADATYTLRGTDEYGRTTDDTFTLEITAIAATITIDTFTYTRGTAGVAPTLDSTVSSTGTVTGDFTLYWATRSTGTPLSKTNIENGTGDALDNGSITAAALADLDGSLDLSTSLTSGAIDAFIRDSSGTPVESDVVSETGVTYDAAAPAFSSAEIGAVDDTSLVVTFNKATYGATSAADWDVQVNGSPATESAVAFTPGGTTVDITLGAAVVNGDTVTVAYNGTGLLGVDAEVVAKFSAQSVTNNVAASGISVDANSEVVNSTTNAASYSGSLYTPAAGSDRIIVAMVSWNPNAVAVSSFTFSLGGTAFTTITPLLSDAFRAITAMAILKEADIPAGSDLSTSVDFGGVTVGGCYVRLVQISGASQAGTNNYETTLNTSSTSPGGNVTVNASAADTIVISSVTARNEANTIDTHTTNSGGTLTSLYNVTNAEGIKFRGAYEIVPSGSVTHSWTTNPDGSNAGAMLELEPV